jgi:hypothetical protein
MMLVEGVEEIDTGAMVFSRLPNYVLVSHVSLYTKGTTRHNVEADESGSC